MQVLNWEGAGEEVRQGYHGVDGFRRASQRIRSHPPMNTEQRPAEVA